MENYTVSPVYLLTRILGYLEEEKAPRVPFSSLWGIRGQVFVGPQMTFGVFHLFGFLYLDPVVDLR